MNWDNICIIKLWWHNHCILLPACRASWSDPEVLELLPDNITRLIHRFPDVQKKLVPCKIRWVCVCSFDDSLLISVIYTFWAFKWLVKCEVSVPYCYHLLIPQNGKGGDSCPKMKLRLHLLVLCVIIIFLVYNMANFQHKQTSVIINIPDLLGTEFSEQKYTWWMNMMWLCNFTVGSKISTIWYCDGMWKHYFDQNSEKCFSILIQKQIFLLIRHGLHLQFKHQVSDRAAVKVSKKPVARIGYLPHGIVESNSDVELKPLWLTTNAQSQVNWVTHLKCFDSITIIFLLVSLVKLNNHQLFPPPKYKILFSYLMLCGFFVPEV